MLQIWLCDPSLFSVGQVLDIADEIFQIQGHLTYFQGQIRSKYLIKVKIKLFYHFPI